MKPKKYEEVDYIAIKPKRPIFIAIILILTAFIVIQIVIITKCVIELIGLRNENEELSKVIQMKDSMISDIQEDNIKLQEMIK